MKIRRKIVSALLVVNILLGLLPASAVNTEAAIAENYSQTICLSERGTTSAITEDGSLYVWGSNYYGQVGNGTTTTQKKPVKIMSDVKAVSLGLYHSAAITEDGSLYMWGYNYSGQVGNGTTTNQKKPVKIMSDVKAVSLGDYHSAAITEDGSLYVWGQNNDGEVGNKTNTSCTKPVKVLSNVKYVTLGTQRSAAITNAGDLYTWGWNYYGQVGNGTTKNQNSPVKVMSNVRCVTMGSGRWSQTTAAITTDGNLYTWGANEEGQIGNGRTSNQLTPVKVLANVTSVELGDYHSIAATVDGSLYVWGYNYYGQIGDGTTTKRTRPTKVLSGVDFVAANYNSSCNFVIMQDGSLYSWGSNGWGQVGNGTKVNQTKPVKIMDDIYDAYANTGYSAAVTNDGTLYVWGYNSSGQVGNGTTTVQTKPVKILENVKLPEKAVKPLFMDVAANAWYYDAVSYVCEKGLMTGYSGVNAGKFGPTNNLARAEFAVIMYRIEGEPEVEYVNKFADVSSNAYYADAVTWASDNGIIKGYDKTGLFGPSDSITRAQMATILYRYAQNKKMDITDSSDIAAFPDVEQVQDFAVEPLKWAVGAGIISGDNGNLKPNSSAVRAQAAVMLMRFVEKYS